MKISTVWCLIPRQVSTGLVRKSHDQSFEECRFRNCSHVDSGRSGDGSMPCTLRMLRIVVRETDLIPSFRYSSSIRGRPQAGNMGITTTSCVTRLCSGSPHTFHGLTVLGRPELFLECLLQHNRDKMPKLISHGLAKSDQFPPLLWCQKHSLRGLRSGNLILNHGYWI